MEVKRSNVIKEFAEDFNEPMPNIRSAKKEMRPVAGLDVRLHYAAKIKGPMEGIVSHGQGWQGGSSYIQYEFH